MLLGELLKDYAQECDNQPNGESPVTSLVSDSRLAKPGSLFIAIKGYEFDGHDYVEAAVQNGAIAVITEKEMNYPDVCCIRVDDSRQVQALLADRFYGNPAAELDLFGITGTNGKTTSAIILQSVLGHCGVDTGLLGTIFYRWGQKERNAVRTTPDAIEIHALLREMVDDKVKAVAMEVSSHALELDRVTGLKFKAAIYTNLSRDHLDFHASFEEYAQAKAKLFRQTEGGVCVLNRDDAAWETMAKEANGRIVTFGKSGSKEASESDYLIRDIKESLEGTEFVLDSGNYRETFFTPIWGLYNVSNAAGVAIAALESGYDSDKIIQGIKSVNRVPGRMDGLTSSTGFRVVIDYAHTPDALENVLNGVRSFTNGKMITVVGCGGDRDRGKRPEMGEIGERLSDTLVVTSDNPRTEDPEKIIEDIVAGLKKPEKSFVLVDRKEAIRKALESAKTGDTVVIAGKGHENYQEINNVRYPFDDREVADSILKEIET